ncbi:hypothetical protein KW799_00170 [Candidatus Parcubacteria bacterium]|nr:hypothetical protein [Candidatus Parcubacteria bacterium]
MSKRKVTPKELARFLWNLFTSLAFSWEKCQTCRWNKSPQSLHIETCFDCGDAKARKPVCKNVRIAL